MFNFFCEKSFIYVKYYVFIYYNFLKSYFYPKIITTIDNIDDDNHHIKFVYENYDFCLICSKKEEVYKIRDKLYEELKNKHPKRFLKKHKFYKNGVLINLGNLLHNYSWSDLPMKVFDIIKYNNHDVSDIYINGIKYSEESNILISDMFDKN